MGLRSVIKTGDQQRNWSASTVLCLLLCGLAVRDEGVRTDLKSLGERRKLHNDELSDLYSLPNIGRVVKSRRMRWAGHVARMVEGRGVHRFLVGKREGKRPLGRPRRRWEKILRWIFRKWEGVVGTGWIWLRIWTGGGNLWVRLGTFGFQKCGEFLD